MARPIADTRIHDRSARARLAPRRSPYWRFILEGFHLGYYRGPHKAAWVARLWQAEEGAYRTETLGETDDLAAADGKTVLSYRQALDKAQAWRTLVEEGGDSAADSEVTVGQVVQAYIERRDARRTAQAGRTLKSDAHIKLRKHVLADKRFAAIAMRDLTEAHLIAWQKRIAGHAPAGRQRIVNDLKAALNAGFAMHRRALPNDLPITIRYGLIVEVREMTIARARENQILSDDEVRRIIAAAYEVDADLARLVVLLAATGARFSQIARMRVGDVQAGQGRVMVPQSFKGKRPRIDYIRIALGADTLAALEPAIAGRGLAAPLLERTRVRQVGPCEWVPYERGPWNSSSEMLRPWAQVVERAGLPATTIPYALRHSSIVRGLRAGLPIRLVAALHDTSVAMIERHYSRWITEGLEELVARAVVPLVGRFDEAA